MVAIGKPSLPPPLVVDHNMGLTYKASLLAGTQGKAACMDTAVVIMHAGNPNRQGSGPWEGSVKGGHVGDAS